MSSVALGGLQPTAAEPDSPQARLYTEVVEPAPAPKGWVQFCKDRPPECTFEQREARTPELNDTRLAELENVNRQVNKQVKPRTDRKNYGVSEKWTYPDNGYGDCEDYALLKRRRLLELGWPAESLLITTVWDKSAGHTVLTVHSDKGEYVLDNQTSKILLWSKTRYDFVQRQSREYPNLWVFIDGAQPAPAIAARNVSE